MTIRVETFEATGVDHPLERSFLAMLTVETVKRGVPTGLSVVMPFYDATLEGAYTKAEAFFAAEQARHAAVRANIERAEADRAVARQSKGKAA